MGRFQRILVLAAASAPILALAAPGFAHDTDPNPDYNGCSSGDFCIWNRINWNAVDGTADWNGSDGSFTGLYQGEAFALNNSASSMWNRGTTCAIYLYLDAWWSGVALQYPIGATTANNATISDIWNWNDTISSTHWCNNNHS